MDGISSAASVIAVIQLTGSLDLQKFLMGNDGKTLSTSLRLANTITNCLSDLQGLEIKLDPGKGKKLIRKGLSHSPIGTKPNVSKALEPSSFRRSQTRLYHYLIKNAFSVRSLKDTNYLGASFFFKRGEGDRGNTRKFFPTLIRQLIFRIPRLRASVQKAFDKDPKIAIKSLKEVKAIHLRIFLTNRPELLINLGFLEIANHKYQDLALYKIPEEETEHDIFLFL
ncbi:uncharacterized protein N7518_002792 [Penicillium psychrosexuale]|uniref:uncharacterized protein n=1 Tax=Penicillium psychrosexuale TaxID=1002107 RepID=UPI0025457462|nr:uncharacterized protein N7518_002792 [Penicillium psychrosexuale]KAJ5800724.1 hypothetical protein N7518_002792 [Penicillium psychrosexuale]